MGSAGGGSWGEQWRGPLIQTMTNLNCCNKFCILKSTVQNETTRRALWSKTVAHHKGGMYDHEPTSSFRFIYQANLVGRGALLAAKNAREAPLLRRTVAPGRAGEGRIRRLFAANSGSLGRWGQGKNALAALTYVRWVRCACWSAAQVPTNLASSIRDTASLLVRGWWNPASPCPKGAVLTESALLIR